MEDLQAVPDSTLDLESRDPLIFLDEPDELVMADAEERRSPGQMIEDQGRLAKSRQKAGMKPGKLEKTLTGNFIAYKALTLKKVCLIGMVKNVSTMEAQVLVHRYAPVSDGHLRLKWMPIFDHNGEEVLGSGDKPSEEVVSETRIIDTVVLNDE